MTLPRTKHRRIEILSPETAASTSQRLHRRRMVTEGHRNPVPMAVITTTKALLIAMETESSTLLGLEGQRKLLSYRPMDSLRAHQARDLQHTAVFRHIEVLK